VIGFLATVADGNPPTWRQHRGVRTTRLRRPQVRALVRSAPYVHRSPSRVRDVRETPLCVGRDDDGV